MPLCGVYGKPFNSNTKLIYFLPRNTDLLFFEHNCSVFTRSPYGMTLAFFYSTVNDSDNSRKKSFRRRSIKKYTTDSRCTGNPVMSNSNRLTVPLWFLFGGRHLIVGKAISLMRAIDTEGSITRAAAAVPMSYRSAWDLVDNINNSSPQPVVITSTGGRNGGGASLSEHGKELLSLYTSLERSYETFSSTAAVRERGFGGFFTFMNGVCMKSSARNQLYGTVGRVEKGVVNSRIVVNVGNRLRIVSTITNESVETLELKEGSDVVALIKASSVILFADTTTTTSAENLLKGTVAEIRPGKVNAEVILQLEGGKTIASVVTLESTRHLDVKEGAVFSAAFSASQVILALSV